jgi:hypothetical protein
MLLAMPSYEPCLRVMDFKKGSPAFQAVEPTDFLCSFSYPFATPVTRIMDMTIRSDPAPSWTPNHQLKVPFSVANDDRLFVISLTVLHAPDPVYLFVPLSTFVTHMSTIDEGQEGRLFKWEDWGPSGSRMIDLLLPSEVWVCHVFGTKFVTIDEDADVHFRLDEPEDRLVVAIYDFNQLAYRREFNRTRGGPVTGTQFVSSDMSCCRPNVTASLPYRKWTIAVDKLSAADAVMCSEDNIIIVKVCTLPKVSY